MAHTPGPWVTSETKFANGIKTEVEAVNESGPICACIRTVNVRKVRTWDEVDANAKLIAAAPELLAALKECRDKVCPDLDSMPRVTETAIGQLVRMVHDAINKAEGKKTT